MKKNPTVDASMQELENPLKDIWEQIREIVLSVDPKMDEDIKWGTPTFIYKGNLSIFNPQAKKSINLTFHTFALIDDPEDVLEGDAKEARLFRVESMEVLSKMKAGLEKVVKDWIQLKDQ